jgi:hypothetical protein
LHVTISPVLAGPVPGETATVSSVERPGATVDGLAAPAAAGFAADADAAVEAATTAASATNASFALTGRLL